MESSSTGHGLSPRVPSSATVWPSLSPPLQLLMLQAHASLSQALGSAGHDREAIVRICAAVVAHVATRDNAGLPTQMALDHRACRIVIGHRNTKPSSLLIADALARPTPEHLAMAAQADPCGATDGQTPVAGEPQASPG